MSAVPLRLSLEPLLATRTPSADGWFEYGFRLRLPDGLALKRNDPLLAAYGARVALLGAENEHEESLQAEEFDPGRAVELVADTGVSETVAVWDACSERQAGVLATEAVAAAAGAALEHGLEIRALVLTEDRSVGDDRREGLDLLVFSPALVEVDTRSASSFERPVRATRPRLVLVVDRSGDVRWWDPSASRGPLPADELPMSQELAGDLQRLREAYAELREKKGGEPHVLDGSPVDFMRRLIDEQAAKLWRRARAELGRRYAVGFLGAGMRRPIWSPGELGGDDQSEDDDIPF